MDENLDESMRDILPNIFRCLKEQWGVLHQDLGYKSHAFLSEIDRVTNGGRHYVFQQDSAPSHKALKTQDWMDGREFSSSYHTKLIASSQPLTRP
ncbi:hypothetical protein ACTXT7_017596 [Hymenolepis weldensis]